MSATLIAPNNWLSYTAGAGFAEFSNALNAAPVNTGVPVIVVTGGHNERESIFSLPYGQPSETIPTLPGLLLFIIFPEWLC